MPRIVLSSDEAWREHIRPDAITSDRWMDDSKKISSEIGLSKRELFGLVLLANARGCQSGSGPWQVGYDPASGEPNDGFVTDGSTKTFAEHKIVSQRSEKEALEALLATYEKYAGRGRAYGSQRVLIVHTNKDTNGQPVEISRLSEEIQERGACPFDGVISIACIDRPSSRNGIFWMLEHFPDQNNSVRIDF